MPPLSDLRSDSPLNFICVACSYLGSSEHLSRARMRFCCHSEVFGFPDARSIHHASSHTRSCLLPHSSPWLSASSDLRHTGVTAVIKLSLEPIQRHSLSARCFTLAGVEPGVDLNAVAQLFARVPSSPRRIVRENNGARVCVLSGTKSVGRGFSCAGVIRHTTHRSLTSPSLSVSDRRETVVRTLARGSSMLRRQVPNYCGSLQPLWAHCSYEIPGKQPTERSSLCTKVEEQ